MTTTALIGANGQLGTDLRACLPGEVVPLGHADLEITDPGAVSGVLGALRPALVINCAAYNFVDRAENEPERAYAVNALGPRNLARFCGECDSVLVHVSTDYVFGLDRTRTRPYVETDPPGPLGAYGVSKLAGEYFVRSMCPRHYVVRTCGLYGHVGARGKGNFVETMLRLGAERDELRVVDDQCCTPTSTADLAGAIRALVATDAYGLYHATNAGSMTWYQFACEIFRQAGVRVHVRPITTAEFCSPAPRPHYSVLDGGKLAAVIGRELPPWQDALCRYLAARVSRETVGENG